MRELYLHIGTHKTGTSSIQSMLKSNKSILNENNIFLLHRDEDKEIKPDWFFDFSNFPKLDSNGLELKNHKNIAEFIKKKVKRKWQVHTYKRGFFLHFQ